MKDPRYRKIEKFVELISPILSALSYKPEEMDEETKLYFIALAKNRPKRCPAKKTCFPLSQNHWSGNDFLCIGQTNRLKNLDYLRACQTIFHSKYGKKLSISYFTVSEGAIHAAILSEAISHFYVINDVHKYNQLIEKQIENRNLSLKSKSKK